EQCCKCSNDWPDERFRQVSLYLWDQENCPHGDQCDDRRSLKCFYLLQKNQYRDAVGKADGHRIWNEMNVLAEFQEPVPDLQHTGDDAGCKQCLGSAVLDIDGCENDGHATGGSGDLLRSSTEQ